MIRGAIFDFDGTLFDSMSIWDNVGEIYLRSLGRDPRPDLQHRLETMSLLQAADHFRTEYDIDLTDEEMIGGINKIIERFYFYDVQPKAGAVQFLNQLHERSVKMCIATATDRCQIEAALYRCGMKYLFDTILTCTEVGSGKDEPEIFYKALSAIGTDQKKTVVFEDAFHALKTAKNAGFITAGVYDAHEKDAERIMALSDIYLNDFRNSAEFWRFAADL